MLTYILTYIRKLLFVINNSRHPDGSFDYGTAGYILKFSGALSASLVAFVNCNGQMFCFGSSCEEYVCRLPYCERLY